MSDYNETAKTKACWRCGSVGNCCGRQESPEEIALREEVERLTKLFKVSEDTKYQYLIELEKAEAQNKVLRNTTLEEAAEICDELDGGCNRFSNAIRKRSEEVDTHE